MQSYEWADIANLPDNAPGAAADTADAAAEDAEAGTLASAPANAAANSPANAAVNALASAPAAAGNGDNVVNDNNNNDNSNSDTVDAWQSDRVIIMEYLKSGDLNTLIKQLTAVGDVPDFKHLWQIFCCCKLRPCFEHPSSLTQWRLTPTLYLQQLVIRGVVAL